MVKKRRKAQDKMLRKICGGEARLVGVPVMIAGVTPSTMQLVSYWHVSRAPKADGGGYSNHPKFEDQRVIEGEENGVVDRGFSQQNRISASQTQEVDLSQTTGIGKPYQMRKRSRGYKTKVSLEVEF